METLNALFSACEHKQDSNEIPTAIRMFQGSSKASGNDVRPNWETPEV